jgi:hypothetical protein
MLPTTTYVHRKSHPTVHPMRRRWTGAPRSHQRTWAEKDGRSPSIAFEPREMARVPRNPDFLESLVGPTNFERLSLEKGVRAVLSSPAFREIRGISLAFREIWGTRQSLVGTEKRGLRKDHNHRDRSQVAKIPEYTAIPATASTPIASRASISTCSRIPPATISRRLVVRFSRCATSRGNPCIVPSRSICV